MCVTATVALIAGLASTAIGTGATLYASDTAAKQQESNLKYQADQANADAAAEKGAAMVEADRIRKAGKMQRAQATAAAAASGVDVNSPTAIRIDEEITKNSETDALLTILNGNDRSQRMNNQASVDRAGASMVRSEARGQQAATLLSAAASSATTYSNWKRA
ncbi:MAG: hypothetical protein M3Q96_01800 [Pseudomonadota bacterium]|nr:hypothetical protein [Pseudomonadota bacterium]MDQ3140104.1 hypothetical protein [Pseudomonadota bacterium]